MSEPNINRMEKAFRGLTIGVVNDLRDFERQRKLDGLTETEEQIHVAISGRAEEFAAWETVDLLFNTVFVDATGQRDSPFDRPHMTFGAALYSPTPVAIHAIVMEWNVTDRNETIGATVAMSATTTDNATQFDADVHLTFQGYGQLATGLPEDIGL